MAFFGVPNPWTRDEAPNVDMTQAPPLPERPIPELPVDLLDKIINDDPETVKYDTELVAQGSKLLPVPLNKYQTQALKEYLQFLDLLFYDTRKERTPVLINTAELFYKHIMKRAFEENRKNTRIMAGGDLPERPITRNLVGTSKFINTIYRSKSGEFLRVTVFPGSMFFNAHFFDEDLGAPRIPNSHSIYIYSKNEYLPKNSIRRMGKFGVTMDIRAGTQCALRFETRDKGGHNAWADLAAALNRSELGVLMDLIFFLLRSYRKLGPQYCMKPPSALSPTTYKYSQYLTIR